MYLEREIYYIINKEKGKLFMHIPIKRSRNNRIIAGVIGGIAEHYGWNAAIARVLWVIIALTPLPGIIAYLVLWMLMESPE